MDNSVLSSLQEIILLLKTLIGILVTIALFHLLRFGFQFRQINIENEDKIFQARVKFLSEKGDFGELKTFCRELLEKKPNHAYALLNLGYAYFRCKEFSEAEKFLIKVKELYPSWDDKYVAPYLNEIDSKKP